MPALLTYEQALEVKKQFGTPCYVYDRAELEAAARRALALQNLAPFGFTLRYAMKANPNRGVLAIFREMGLHLDASSDHEVERALRAGFTPPSIQLTSQMPSSRLADHLGRGVLYNACSLRQLDDVGQAAPGSEVSVRMNPGDGSGGTKRTTTGGPDSSFGIWHEYLDEVKAHAKKFDLRITRLHSHIGSGTDPEEWRRCAQMTLKLAPELPDVRLINLGGGFSVGRVAGEESVDMAEAGVRMRDELLAFHERYHRKLHLEIEPGTYLVANAGTVVATCVDVVDTGRAGHVFAKLDTGMCEVTRPTLYGAQHPIDVLAAGRPEAEVVFVGPCCESGDILTPAPKDREALAPRRVPLPRINDLVLVGGAGAYCAAMSMINYNSYPQAPEVLREPDGVLRLVRSRQRIEQLWENEV
jgi:diaminopimelate decarboxylase